MGNTNSHDVAVYEFVKRRASFPLWQRYGINKQELWFLTQLSAYLNHENKVIVSTHEFMATMTGTKVEHAKMRGYYSGLLRNGFIGTFEYVNVPGSESVGISELGSRVLREYFSLIAEFCDRYKAHEHRIGVVVNYVEQQPKGRYTAKSA